MGAKYTTKSASGYNSSPPSDDGAQTAANLITWAKHKEKIGDPLKTLAEAINTALVSAFDYAVRQITTSDSLVAGDHMRTVEVAPSVSTVVTVTLADAATMTNIYRVWIKNSGSTTVTIARTTGGDTIDGVAANISIPSKSAILLTTNNAANGYLIAGRAGNKTPTRQVFTSGSGTYTTPTGATHINIRMIGAGGGGGGNGTANQTAGGAGGDTTFSTYTAGGGGGGGPSGANAAGAGGTTAGSPDIGLVGGIGGLGTNSSAVLSGGAGGVGAFGGAGPAGQNGGAGAAGKTNTGGGGGGAGGASGVPSASGGGAGGYVEHRISSLAATYAYGVGAAGTAGGAGTSGAAGGTGGSGLIIVDEFYN